MSETAKLDHHIVLMQRLYRRMIEYVGKTSRLLSLWYTILHLDCHRNRTASPVLPVLNYFAHEFNICRRFLTKYQARFYHLHDVTHAATALRVVVRFVQPRCAARELYLHRLEIGDGDQGEFSSCLHRGIIRQFEQALRVLGERGEEVDYAEMMATVELALRYDFGWLTNLDRMAPTMFNEQIKTEGLRSVHLGKMASHLMEGCRPAEEHRVSLPLQRVSSWYSSWVDLPINDMQFVLPMLKRKGVIARDRRAPADHAQEKRAPPVKPSGAAAPVLTSAKLKKQAKKMLKATKHQLKLTKSDIQQAARFIFCLKAYADHTLTLSRLALYMLNYGLQVIKERTITSEPVVWGRSIGKLDQGLVMVEQLTHKQTALAQYTDPELAGFFVNGERMYLAWTDLLQSLYRSVQVLDGLSDYYNNTVSIDCNTSMAFRDCLSMLMITAVSVPLDDTRTFRDSACDGGVFEMLDAGLRYYEELDTRMTA